MMQTTTYYVTHNAPAGLSEVDAQALVHQINDTGHGNGDNRSWNAMRARVDALLDGETQRRLGIALVAEATEVMEDD